MSVTVIIPTYNRAEKLRRTLFGYLHQTGSHQIVEILVVDDGSTDHTQAVLEECKLFDIRVRSIWQTNQGLAAARNTAIRQAQGELLLFGDDDIIPSPRLTAEHVAWHEKYPEENCGVLGYVPWLPEVKPTPFMTWSGLYGPQFNFGYFTPGGELGFQFGYFCNTSVHASFLHRHGIFSEAFRTYGYEDLELSFRLMRKGYRLLYNPAAAGFHNKFETLEDAITRVGKLYGSWPEFSKTEAGAEFLTLWQQGRQSRPSRRHPALRKVVPAVKNLAAPLIRPLLNTYLPLPGWIYEQVFYHYVTSFASVAEASDPAVRAA